MEGSPPRAEVQVDLQLTDLIRANLWFTYSKRAMKFSVVMFCLSVLISVALLTLARVPSWFGFVPLILVVLFGLTPLLIVLETKRNFAAAREFQKHIHYVFAGQGYDASDGKSSSHVSWESIQKAVESKHSLNLFISRTLFVVIPKRCLSASDDLVRLRLILQEALGEKATMKSATN